MTRGAGWAIALAGMLVALTTAAQAVPVAVQTAAPNPIKETKAFTLSGVGSYDTDATPVYFYFYRLETTGVFTLLQASQVPTCATVAPAVNPGNGVYLYRLVVYNYLFTTYGYADVNVTVLDNPPATADAGTAQRTRVLRPGVTLDGSKSKDPEGAALAYSWAQIGGTPVTLSGPGTVKPTFTAPATPQVLTFQLIVTESDGTSAGPVTTTVTTEANLPPTNVDAGLQQDVASGDAVALVGKATDPNTDPLSYKWTKVSGPQTISIAHADTANATFKAPSVGAEETYVFRLDVTDGAATQSDETSVLVRMPGAASGLPLLSNQKTFPSPFSPAKGGATIRYTLRSASDVNMRISDIFGREVRELRASAGATGGSAGDNDVLWDGRNGEGELVSNGIYIVQVDARDASGAQAKVTDKVGVRR